MGDFFGLEPFICSQLGKGQVSVPNTTTAKAKVSENLSGWLTAESCWSFTGDVFFLSKKSGR